MEFLLGKQKDEALKATVEDSNETYMPDIKEKQ